MTNDSMIEKVQTLCYFLQDFMKISEMHNEIRLNFEMVRSIGTDSCQYRIIAKYRNPDLEQAKIDGNFQIS